MCKRESKYGLQAMYRHLCMMWYISSKNFHSKDWQLRIGSFSEPVAFFLKKVPCSIGSPVCYLEFSNPISWERWLFSYNGFVWKHNIFRKKKWNNAGRSSKLNLQLEDCTKTYKLDCKNSYKSVAPKHKIKYNTSP